MARYGRDYEDVSRGMNRFYGPERHLFEGLFSSRDRDRDDLDRGDWDRSNWDRNDRDRNDRGRWMGGGRYDRDHGAGGMGAGGMGMGGGMMGRGYGRDYTAGGPGYTGGSSMGRDSSWDPGYRGGRVQGRYDGDFGYGSGASNMGGTMGHGYVGRDRDAGWSRARDDYGARGMNRGGDWDGDGDRDMGDRLREGWSDLRQGARRVFRGHGNTSRYDRNW